MRQWPFPPVDNYINTTHLVCYSRAVRSHISVWWAIMGLRGHWLDGAECPPAVANSHASPVYRSCLARKGHISTVDKRSDIHSRGGTFLYHAKWRYIIKNEAPLNSSVSVSNRVIYIAEEGTECPVFVIYIATSRHLHCSIASQPW